MTLNTLKGRIERLEVLQNPPPTRSCVIYIREGESEMDLARRVAAVGRPVMVTPKPCATVEEWLLKCGPKGLA